MPRGVASVGLVGLAVLVASAWLAAPADAEAPADYRIAVPAEHGLDVGATSSISLTIAARPGYTVSKDAPVTLALAIEPAKGLKLLKSRYARKDAADVRAADPRFDLRVRGSTAGSYRLRIRARFWVCGARTCRPVDDKRTINVTVRAPAPDDSGASEAPSP